MNIRLIEVKDAPAIAQLMTQLGYITTEKQMQDRLNKLKHHEDYEGIVAEQDGTIVAFVGLHDGLLFKDDQSYVRVIAFVVDETCRGQGIGTALLKEVERWAKQKGATSVTLNSGNRTERKDAHHFYIERGFQPKSTGFVKKMK
ncbi:GNAT family N-acetyltransferase [Metabacillus iocasae]|uniref:GNAT superfamily N-acetyltransferase n=1 Tax=Priestia iocasae TaxID=2291674 RepID=A0ABS2QTJ7_9BACI|nr:GNAT family N-acetyltransferase [Metabacillus iocasae]MBM7702804.1 GNAT superfamily N-acetyltransferase [Metabacillus iocasae]